MEFIGKFNRVWRRLRGGARFDRLPMLCGARDPSNNQPVSIWRGETGYFLWTESKTPEEWNQEHGISPAQVRAMMEGSTLGWRISEPTAQRKRREGLPK